MTVEMFSSVWLSRVVLLQLFDNILLTLPRQTTSSTGKSPSASVLELAYDIQAKLPNVYDMEMVIDSVVIICSWHLTIFLILYRYSFCRFCSCWAMLFKKAWGSVVQMGSGWNLTGTESDFRYDVILSRWRRTPLSAASAVLWSGHFCIQLLIHSTFVLVYCIQGGPKSTRRSYRYLA